MGLEVTRIADGGLDKMFEGKLRFWWMLMTACLVSCGDEDRILKVTCDPTSVEEISLDFGSPNITGMSAALLNAHQFAPGMIIRLMSAASANEVGGGNRPYVLHTFKEDFSPSKVQGAAVVKVVSAPFRIKFDADVEQTVRPLSIDLKSEVVRNTLLVATGVQRMDLQDPLGLINADRDAVALIRASPRRSRFVVVTGGVYADDAGLYYFGSFFPNTLRVANFYLHVDYACPAATTSHRGATLSDRGAPIVIVYAPVTYDATNEKVQVDTRPIDLTQYTFAGAPM
jgi:hypothetical protein